MRFFKWVSGLFPNTRNKIEKIDDFNKRFLAASSLGSLLGFLAFLPVIITFDRFGSPQTTAMIIIGYALAIFLFTGLSIIVSKVGIAEDLFNDYSNWPKPIHLCLILGSVVGVFVLVIAKIYATIYLLPKDESGTTQQQ